MFATIPPRTPAKDPFAGRFPAAQPFSSPLSPRDVNVPSRCAPPMFREKPHTPDSKSRSYPSASLPSFSPAPTFPFSSPTSQQAPFSSPSSSYAQRYASTIHNPAGRIAQRAQSRDKRRGQFLNKVKQTREETAFDTRAEQMQRWQGLAQRQEFLEQMEKSAPDFGYIAEEEEEEEGEEPHQEGTMEGQQIHMGGDSGATYPWLAQNGTEGSSGYIDGDEAALEELISEEQKFQAMVEEMEQMQDTNQTGQIPADDDYYDSLFTDLLRDGNDTNPTFHHERMDTT